MTQPDSLELQFAFDGLLGDKLQECLHADRIAAQLSRKFRIYYSLRRYIPIAVRQLLQRQRSQQMTHACDWYMSHVFLAGWRKVVDEEIAAGDPLVKHPWPQPYSHATVLTHDVETREGFKRIDRLAQAEEKHNLRSAWFVIPHKYPIDYGMLSDLKARGHEISVHGYNHDGRLFTSRKIFDYRSKKINAALKELAACGFRAPMVHRELCWMQDLAVDYDASCFDVDPYQAMPGGVGGVWPFTCGRFVELPYTLPQDHTLLSLNQLSHRIWVEKYELLRRMRGMALLITHPDYLDTTKTVAEYERFLAHIAADESAFRCLPRDAARWWRLRLDAPLANTALQTEDPQCTVARIPVSQLFADL